MTTIRKVLVQSQDCPTTQTTVYTAPANTKATIDKMTATNNTAGALTLSINLVPSAGTAANSNRITAAVSIAAGAVYECSEIAGHDLSPGDFVSVIASGAGITIRASGREIT